MENTEEPNFTMMVAVIVTADSASKASVDFPSLLPSGRRRLGGTFVRMAISLGKKL